MLRSSDHEMPFLDHLEELRWRIIWSLAAVLLSVGIGFYLVLRFGMIAMLEQPILPYLHGHHVTATHPTDGLQLTITAAMWIGVVLAFPIVVYQAWLFLAPALFTREKRMLASALAGGIALFVAGAVFAFKVMLPISLPWLFGLFGSLETLITAENYFGFVFSMVLTFGVAFELPVVVLLLAAIGLVTPQLLNRYRRHALVAIVVLAAFLTPGDIWMSTIALSVPLYALYEVSVLVSYVIWRHRATDGDALALLLAPLVLLSRRRSLRPVH